MFTTKFFRGLGANTRDRYRDYIFDGAKDVFGKRFKGYSNEYGKRKRANKFNEQSSKYANSTAPVLTSKFYKDISVQSPNPNGFQLKWAILGARVGHLAKMGRVVTSSIQPLPKDTIKAMERDIKVYVDKHKLPKSKTTRFKIGK